jgi:Fibronectin type III domain/Carbohydrate binding domain
MREFRWAVMACLTILLAAAGTFGASNLMKNGGFKSVDRKKKMPKGWSATTGNKTWGTQGTISIVKSPRPRGGNAVRIRKTVAEAWYPQLWSPTINVKPGTRVAATAWVKANQPWHFRYVMMKKGEAHKKHSKVFSPSPVMRQASFDFIVPSPYNQVRLAFQISGAKGELIVDDVSLRKGSAKTSSGEMAGPHPIHRMIELSRRSRVIPVDVISPDRKAFPSERVIFRDTATGATIWKMTRWPGSSRHHYSNMRTWNANGSLIRIRSDRAGITKAATLLLSADGSGMKRVDVAGRQWCAVNPERLYYPVWHSDGMMTVMWYDVFTGKTYSLPKKTPQGTLIPVSKDGKKILAVKGGYSATNRKSVGTLIDVATGNYKTIEFGYTTHQVWFTKRPDYTISFNYESRNKYYKQSGGGSNLIDADGKNLRRIRKKHCTHRGFSPDGKRVAFHHSGIRVMNVDGTNERLASKRGGGHLAWVVSPDWLIATARNTIRCIGMSNQGYEYVISHPNTQLGFSEYQTEAHLDSSPDGTKIGYASSMLGDTDFYQVVARLPGQPRTVRATMKGRKVSLKWQPPTFGKEILGYLVYRAYSSGLDFKQITPKLVRGNSYSENLPRGRTSAYYIVTAIEHSGIEGRPSQEVCASPKGGWTGRVRHYYEVEDGAVQKPLMEHYDSTASGMYVLRVDHADKGVVTLPVTVPVDGEYSLWLRARAFGKTNVSIAVGGKALKARIASSKPYAWVRAGAMPLKAGVHQITLTANGADIRLDSLFLADQSTITPQAHGLWDIVPPAAPKDLRSKKRGAYEVNLAWDAVKGVDVAYYNVYASTRKGFHCRQEQRIASPMKPATLDWGLQHSTDYYYRVTAVDRRGNESKPSSELAVTTRSGGKVVVRKTIGKRSKRTPVTIRRFTNDELGKMNALPNRFERVTSSNPLNLSLDVPKSGEYLIWAKVAVGKGYSRKRGLVVRVNGKRITWKPAFNFVSIGHSGPTPGVFVWDVIGTDRMERITLPKGKVKLEISAPKGGEFFFAEFVLTNNFGWQPDGISSWLPVSQPWLKERIPTKG